ncbi:MAG: hypothetical protein ABSF60_05105 [Verrucomicrobiota bacterium]|jgi:hypothetical protein
MAARNPTDEIKPPLIIKPDPFTYFLGGALAFIFWQPMLVTLALGRWDGELFALSFGLTASLFILIHGCRIIVSERGLAYKRLFIWSRSFAFEQMKELKIEAGRSRNKPIYRLVITPHTPAQDPLTINIKLFSRARLSMLMQIISSNAPGVQLDKGCERVKERFMPSLLGDEKNMRSRSKILNYLLKER